MKRLTLLLGVSLLLSYVAANAQLHAGASLPADTLVDLPSPGASEVVNFYRHQFTVRRQRGKVLIDGVVIPKDFVERGSKEVRLIETFDDLSFDSTHEFRSWVKMLRGTRTYTYDNVHLRNERGSIDVIPLVLLDEQRRRKVNPVWQEWLSDQRAIQLSKHVASQARKAELDRYQELQRTVREQASALEQLSQAQHPIDDHDNLWVVHLSSQESPAQGVRLSGFQVSAGVTVSQPNLGVRVEVYARDSREAIQSALAQHPGHHLLGARKQRFRL